MWQQKSKNQGGIMAKQKQGGGKTATQLVTTGKKQPVSKRVRNKQIQAKAEFSDKISKARRQQRQGKPLSWEQRELLRAHC